MKNIKLSTIDKIAIAIFIIIIIAFTSFYKGCYNDILQHQESNTIDRYHEAINDSISFYFNKKNKQIVAEKQVAVATAEYLEQENQALKKTLADYKIKLKNLQAYTRIKSNIYDTFITKTTDTFQYFVTINNEKKDTFSFEFQDKWINLQGKAHKNEVKIFYNTVSDLEIITSYKKQNPFKRSLLYINVSDKNPNVRISDIQSYQTQAPKPKWYATRGFAFASGFILGSAGATVGTYFLTK
jgi:hypothetical protein